MNSAGVLDTPDLLLALLPAVGPRSALGSTRSVLKWAPGEPLIVIRSTLEFLAADGTELARYEDAFGLASRHSIAGPCVWSLADESRRPADGLRQRWYLNEHIVEAPMAMPPTSWNVLHATCLPLQLPLPEDIHVLAELVNLDDRPVDMAAGVRDARCWVDGKAFPSNAGALWDGRYLLDPGHAALRRFRLADFPGVPTVGAHEISLELLGRRSAPARVCWHGTPWTGDDTEQSRNTDL
jgi:hypothetical protein